MHKFHLGQAVAYRATRGLYSAFGAYVVTAKLPERAGQYEYRIRNLAEAHERKARESELQAYE
jgi:predicted ATP-grasp superfamily ATP-dependent carboligase